jgi:hypothetical protein
MTTTRTDISRIESRYIDGRFEISATTTRTGDTAVFLNTPQCAARVARLVARMRQVGTANLDLWEVLPPEDYFDEEREWELRCHELSVRMHGEFGSFGND